MKNNKQFAAMTSALSMLVVAAGMACSSPALASPAPGEQSQSSSTNRNLERLIKSTFETPESVDRGAPTRRLGGGSRYVDSLPILTDIP